MSRTREDRRTSRNQAKRNAIHREWNIRNCTVKCWQEYDPTVRENRAGNNGRIASAHRWLNQVAMERRQGNLGRARRHLELVRYNLRNR